MGRARWRSSPICGTSSLRLQRNWCLRPWHNVARVFGAFGDTMVLASVAQVALTFTAFLEAFRCFRLDGTWPRGLVVRTLFHHSFSVPFLADEACSLFNYLFLSRPGYFLLQHSRIFEPVPGSSPSHPCLSPNSVIDVCLQQHLAVRATQTLDRHIRLLACDH